MFASISLLECYTYVFRDISGKIDQAVQVVPANALRTIQYHPRSCEIDVGGQERQWIYHGGKTGWGEDTASQTWQ